MATSTLAIQNVINISVANPPAGLANYQLANLLYVTKEAPVNPALGAYTVYLEPSSVAADWGATSEAYQAALAIFAQTPNILTPGGALIIAAMAGGDTLSSMYLALKDSIFFGAMIYGGYQPNDAEILAAAAVYQADQRLLFACSNDATELQAGNAFFQIQAAGYSHTRCLLYTVDPVSARIFAAAYASLGLSTDWSGANTASTQALKDLSGILPDPGITQTLLNTCETVGVDVYTTIGPLPKIFSTGGNTYYDQVFGTVWLALALQVAGFNALAQTPTKLPQTEIGVAYLRNAYTSVLEQGVVNGFLAPGAWNSAQTFGDPATLRNAVLTVGYFVYSLPVNKQSQPDRVARKAPLIQIAAKLAGAIQSSSVIVYVNP